MTIHLYNTLTREKQIFEPLDPKNVRLYVCGPTVYDYAHIGNARPVVAFDVLFRLLRHTYGAGHVTYARNITDIDDKIMEESVRTGEPIESITNRTAGWYHQDMGALNALSPTHEPRATEFVPQMVKLIVRLIDKGFAYVAEGHVLFNVPAMTDYGQLSKRSLDDMIAGARVDVAPYKKSPADFVLWKPSAVGQPGWDSPWGRGRPGWHIECSAMAGELMGEVFDIHGGGIDLIFPHHENEIAQSRCAHGTPVMARYWMHNGFVQVNGQKMSKSLGNFFTVRELLEKGDHGEAIRLALLSAHYRQPTDITAPGLVEAKTRLDRLYSALAKVDHLEVVPQVTDHVLAAIADDLNTHLAIAELHVLLSRLNKATSEVEQRTAKAALLGAGELLGLLTVDPRKWRYSMPPGRGHISEPKFPMRRGVMESSSPPRPLVEDEIERLIEARNAARKAKNFAEADRIRDELASWDVVLEDGPEGTRRKLT